MQFFRLFFLLVTLSCFFSHNTFAQKEIPDTVYTGIYITSIHDIDFKEKEYTVSFWLWLKYKNVGFDFIQNLEVPQAKTVTKSFSTVDSSNNRVYLLMKLQCVMKDSWEISNFPFDRQKLTLSIENSQYDSKALVFTTDTFGKHFDPRFALQGWTIDTFKIDTKVKAYETAFGDPRLLKPHSEYSSYIVNIGLERNALGLFWKMFIGMYLSFFIAYACFFIHLDSIESRFGLAVGSLFAVIGNKYVIDSSLPESSTFTLVDTLHGITLFFIFVVIVCTIYALSLIKKQDIPKANSFDNKAAVIVLVLYVILNTYFIYQASLF